MIKDDRGGTRNPYKCINVMKQDAMNDKIRKRCKTCEKQCMQEDLDRSRGVEKLSNRQEISQSIHLAVERCQDCDKNQLKISIEKPGVERC